MINNTIRFPKGSGFFYNLIYEVNRRNNNVII